ncbi:MAG: universal stress protein [Deltaproteobacteria bacterium]|nr:universal stress protein [Deltaproteobacteria bacterium]
MQFFNKILCPTDFSKPSYRALKVADELAKNYSSELFLVHVVVPAQLYPATPGFVPGSPATGGYVPPSVSAEVEGHAAESLDMTLKEKISSEVKATAKLLRGGNVAEEITRFAETSDVNCIVIGTHGFTGWRHLLLGSVTEKVVRMASCPVLTVPADHE